MASTWIEAVLSAHGLSWDLHIHPGRPEDGRWGDGQQVRRAAQRAGVRGFLWKSHSGRSTLVDCQELPRSVPYTLPSITLNGDVSATDIERAIALGVRWVSAVATGRPDPRVGTAPALGLGRHPRDPRRQQGAADAVHLSP